MSRKKVIKKPTAKKATTTNAKRPAKKAVSTGTDSVEKNFRDTPAKLIAQFGKELSGLKQQDKKLQSELKKAQAQKKTSQKQSVTLAAKHKAKPNATIKKQLATQKVTIEKITKIIAGVTAQINVLKLATKALTQKQNKQTAIHKLLTAFEKQWEIKARQAAAPKPRKKAAKKSSASTPATHTTTTHHNEPNLITEDDLETVE
jgi:hypothetical protein